MEFKKLNLYTIPLDGYNLIEASAGTGKTYTIVHLYLRLILEKELPVEKILVVTFTTAATSELRERIHTSLQLSLQNLQVNSEDKILETALKIHGQTRVMGLIKRALIDFDGSAIFTIHGFCKRMLQENSFESGALFDTELITDQNFLIMEIIYDFCRQKYTKSKNSLLWALAYKNKIDVDGLKKLAQIVIQKPKLNLLPADVPDTEIALKACFENLKSIWESQSHDIKALLGKGEKFYSKYRKKVEGHLKALDFCFQIMPSKEGLVALQVFATNQLNQNILQKYDPPEHQFFDLCEEFVNLEQNNIIKLKLDYINFFKKELVQRKQTRNVQSFNELLINLYQGLKLEKGTLLAAAIRDSFKAALIDEFQDTDTIQYEIFSTIFKTKASLFLIGDPKQAIYAFRGADIFSYMQAVKDAPVDRKYTLGTNFRSETAFIKGINVIFNANNPFVFKQIPYLPVEASPSSKGNQADLKIEGRSGAGLILWLMRETKGQISKNKSRKVAVQAVSFEISRLLELSIQGRAMLGSQPLKPADIAVLVSRHEDAHQIYTALALIGIPATVQKNDDIFKTHEAVEILIVLRGIAVSGKYLNAALVTDMIGINAFEICNFMEKEHNLALYEEHIAKFNQYREIWNKIGFMRMFRQLLKDYKVRENLLKFSNGERRLTNVLHLAELIHKTSLENRLGINSTLNWINRQCQSEEKNSEHELRLERDDNAVQILTIFKSKGLQYPVVFCPFLWQGNSNIKGSVVNYHKEEDHKFKEFLNINSSTCSLKKAAREKLAELMRVLYVALTRAQNRCYFTWGKIGRSAGTGLDYLFAGQDLNEPDLVSTLKERINKLKAPQFSKIVSTYIQKDSAGIFVDPIPIETAGKYSPSEADASLQAPANFQACIDQEWRLASYSYLVADQHTKGRTIPDQGIIAQNFFAFPRGASAGTCIHDIFESIDFKDPHAEKNLTIIKQCLSRHGFNEQQHFLVSDMLAKVLQAPLHPYAEIFLQHIPVQDRLCEMEFYFPLKKLTSGHLAQIFKNNKTPYGEQFSKAIRQLSFQDLCGFMHGFIDLVFRYQGKYYLLDWKTNHLGNDYAGYQPEILKNEMCTAFYNLQYYIYTVALHKYLRSRVYGYDYHKNFGGVFYLFVRGITPQQPGCGIFYDCPDFKLINALSDLSPVSETKQEQLCFINF